VSTDTPESSVPPGYAELLEQLKAGVVDRLAADRWAEFSGQRGWSRRNPLHMRAFAEAWSELGDVVPQAVGRLPWGHVRALLDRLEDRA